MILKINSLSLALFLCAITLLVPLSAKTEMLDRIAAVVNDDVITLSELEDSGREYLARIREKAPADQVDAMLEEGRKRLLDKLINQRLIAQQAVDANIQVPDQELESSYAQQLQKMGLSEEEFRDKLKQSGLSVEKYKTDLRGKILRDKLIRFEVRSKIVVTEEMMKDYYTTKYSEEIEGGGYYLLQMGFTWRDSEEVHNSPELLEADKARARQRAEKARQRIVDGADFGTIARQSSDLPSAADGGDIGVFEKDDMASYMREAIVELDVGEISPVLETPIGYQFFKLLSRKQDEDVERVPFEAVKEDIRQKLMERNFKEVYSQWVEEIKESSYVKKMVYN
ncbi:MAG: peptidylprolyl isomerase [Desulfopila sp.]